MSPKNGQQLGLEAARVKRISFALVLWLGNPRKSKQPNRTSAQLIWRVHKFLRRFNVTVFRAWLYIFGLVRRQDLFRVWPRPRRSLNCLEIADSCLSQPRDGLRKYPSIPTQINEPSPRPHSQMNHKMTVKRAAHAFEQWIGIENTQQI